MCLPLVAVAGIVAAAGSAVSAYGQIKAGNFNAAVGRQNARNLNAAAADAEDRGDLAAGQSATQTGLLLGAQRARLAAGGVDVGSGSALDLLMNTAGIGEQDALTIRNNAAREAWGLRTQAKDQQAQARFARAAGLYGAGSTLLTGAGQVLSGFRK
jgi:hypothetical protein